MDKFLLFCLVFAALGGALSAILEMMQFSGPSKSSKNIFTFLFCDRY
jgi:hypothetical protein